MKKQQTAKIGIIANCQSQTLSTLTSLLLPRYESIVLDLSTPASRNDVFQKQICEQMQGCDFVFVQPNSTVHANQTCIEQFCRGRAIKIANFFFRGLHPDMCMIGDFENRVNAISNNHSIVILDAYLRGLSIQQAVESFNPDNYDRLDLWGAWKSSMLEMRAHDEFVDFPAAKLVEESVLRYPAFFTMNHPKLRLVYDYFILILKELGLNYENIDISKVSDPLNVHDIVGALDLVCDHNKLPYRASETWRMHALGYKFVKIPQLVETFFQTYSEIPHERLKVHSPIDMVKSIEKSPSLRFLIDDVPVPESEKGKLIQKKINQDVIMPPVSREEFLTERDVKIDFVSVTSKADPNFEKMIEVLNNNQPFNTTGRRWTMEECETKLKENWDFAAFTVKDKTSDYGLAACVLISGGNTIEQFVMDTRVMGLDVENKILDWLAALMQKNAAAQIIGRFINTEGNLRCRDMYARCGFVKSGNVWAKTLLSVPDQTKTAI